MKKYKNTTYAVLLILIFAISIAMAFAPTASAQIPWNPRTTAGYISVAPLLIGVGQSATVNLWVLPLPQDAVGAPLYNPKANGGAFSGISVTFKKPDGTTETLTPTDGVGTYPAGYTDALGTLYFYFTPDEAGNWSVTMTMPAQNYTDSTGTVQYLACTSAPAYFTVQTAAVNAGLLNGYPWSPLPNSNVYWTTPINANNREWAAITGDWLQQDISIAPEFLNVGLRWQAYGSGPSTDHILWDIPWVGGGIQGGDLGGTSVMVYSPYNTNSPVIMDGKLYLNVIPDSYTLVGTSSKNIKEFECISLTTGQVLWTAPGFISGGINLPGNAYIQSVEETETSGVVLASSYGKSPSVVLFQSVAGANGPGGEPTTVWNYYDANTGQLDYSITNVTASDFEFIDDSDIAFGCTTLQQSPTTFIYAQNYVWEWNFTKVVGGDWYTGLVWRTTVNNPAKNIAGPGDGSGRYSLAMTPDASTLVYGGGPGGNWVEGFNAQTGASIWNLTLGYNDEASIIQLSNSTDFLEYDPTFATWYCYSDLTGALVWSTPNVGGLPWGTKYGASTSVNDNNNVYIGEPSGSIVALSLATGKVEWTSTPIPSTEYITNAIGVGWLATPIEVGGNLYAYLGYLSSYQIDPIARFACMECVNATTGATEWVLQGGVIPLAAADGYIVGAGISDGNYYCLGKGQTSTSISTGNTVVANGGIVQIQGTVLDESPAQPGTPAVSDSSMSEWMDYLHMQNATLLNSPPTPAGVQVTLTAYDPNHNTENIGTTTTDATGRYIVDWTPPVPGIYNITATFSGTGSYWPSSAETGLTVTTAAAPTTTTTTVVSSGVSSTTLYEAIAAVIIVMIVIAIVLAVLMLRKRP